MGDEGEWDGKDLAAIAVVIVVAFGHIVLGGGELRPTAGAKRFEGPSTVSRKGMGEKLPPADGP